MPFISVVLVTLAGIVISYFILNYCHRRSSIKTVNTLPGPKAFPFIGNGYYFLLQTSNEFLSIITQLTRKYPSPFKFWMANKLIIGVYEFDQMQIILHNSEEKSILYKFLEPMLGRKGLLTAPVSTWIKNRKIIAPIFNTIALRNSFNVFVEQSVILTDQLEKIVLNGNKIILFNDISKYTLNTACGSKITSKEILMTYYHFIKTLLKCHLTSFCYLGIMTNIKPESLSNSINQCVEVITSLKQIFKSRIRNVFLYPDLIFNLTAVGREQQRKINFLHSFTDKIVQQHIYASNAQNAIKYGTTYKTFLDSLIEMSHQDKYPQEMIHDNLITMIIGGTDTIATTVDFVIFMLANFPQIQEKVYKELWEIYKTETPKSAPIKHEDLQHMDYLDRVIKETLRLFPSIPLIGRYLTKDVKMGEIILPKDTEVILGILALHRNEKYWPNPLVFDPDRFLPEKIGTSYKHYMPFSYGLRNCIGMRYAMISMKVVLAVLIRTFMFKVEKNVQIDKIKLNMNITLCTNEPIQVIMEKRELH